MPRDLSQKELAFLVDQRISLMWVYSRLRGESLHESIASMRINDKYVLHGFMKCNCGIALLSRKGDCINCYPKQLEVIHRYTETGYIYVLCSSKTGIIKVGSTGLTPEARTAQLNKAGYAGARDWWVCDFVRVTRRAVLEDQLKVALRPHFIEVPYTRNGHNTYSRETYACSAATAQIALKRLQRGYIKRHRRIQSS